MSTSSTQHCPTCGAPIPPDAPEGRCPACMLQAGLASDAAGPAFTEVPTPGALEALFPQFAVESVLGRGGMGVVYKARQRSLDRPVALKLLPPEIALTPGFAERFRREARTLAQLAHPNIVSVHEAAEAEGHYVLAMEFVDGVNLRQAQEDGGLTPEQALAVVPQICDALQYAHDQGVVHRDIKPDNILLTRDGRVKIADFGLAKLLRRTPGDATLTGTEQVMGTFHYLAPEQIRSPKDVDHRADIYALGVVFYEMLTGELPIGRFPAPSERVQVDVRLDEVVLRALEREREQRYQQAADIKTGIHHATQVQAVVPESVPSPTSEPTASEPTASAPESAPASRWTRMNPWAVASVLCLPAALLAAILIVALGARDEYAFFAAVVLVVTGVILGVIAKHEIQAAPARWHGMGLAKAGVRIPLIGGLVAVLVAVPLIMIQGVEKQQGSDAAHDAARERARRMQIEVTAREKLVYVDRLRGGMMSLDAAAEHVDPRERTVLLDASDEDLRAGFEAKALGLVMFPVEELSAPITKFEVQDVELVGEDAAWVTIAHGEERLRFRMVEYKTRWYLDLEPVVHEPPPPPAGPPVPAEVSDEPFKR